MDSLFLQHKQNFLDIFSGMKWKQFKFRKMISCSNATNFRSIQKSLDILGKLEINEGE
jgi:hypothetical protein